jgi:CubicO group peptidase (beta-lactamase class C family)
MTTPTTKATRFLEQKLRETVAECGVPALAAVMVTGSAPPLIISAQLGVRKMDGGAGSRNRIHPHDRFNLGSISKVFTGNLIGKLIQNGVLEWTTRIVDVFPEFWVFPPARDGYKQVTIEQLIVHTSGMPTEPASDKDRGWDWKNYTALDMTKSNLKKRRRSYVVAALLDAPKFSPPGTGVHYGGGGIIAASMAEQVTGRTYEDLMQTHIYDPLGMSNSGFGELSTGALDGPWQHSWHKETFELKPDPITKRDGYSWNARNPVGGACCSAGDLGKFIREQLRVDPQVFNLGTRSTLQTHQVTRASEFVRGGWGSTIPGSDQAEIWHLGDNGVSFAALSIRLSKKVGFAAMCNANTTFSQPAVSKAMDVLRAMESRWGLFTSNEELVECSHPVPAVVRAGNKMLLFARRHDGNIFRYKSDDGGKVWQAASSFPDAVFTSGLAANVSSNGRHVCVSGRGKDDQIWFTVSSDGGTGWKNWTPIPGGTFQTGPAVTINTHGTSINIFAVGFDSLMYIARSRDSGESWSAWTPIGTGTFTSAPAAVASADGIIVHVFGRGKDWRIWRNVSSHGGVGWLPHWVPIGEDIFTSGPGAAVYKTGTTVHVFARATDRCLWRNKTSTSGSHWLDHWQKCGESAFNSAPAVATDATNVHTQAYAFGNDFGLFKIGSVDAWEDQQRIGHLFFL